MVVYMCVYYEMICAVTVMVDWRKPRVLFSFLFSHHIHTIFSLYFGVLMNVGDLMNRQRWQGRCERRKRLSGWTGLAWPKRFGVSIIDFLFLIFSHSESLHMQSFFCAVLLVVCGCCYYCCWSVTFYNNKLPIHKTHTIFFSPENSVNRNTHQ